MIWIVDINIPDRNGFYIGQVEVEADSKQMAEAAAQYKTGCIPAGAYTLTRPTPIHLREEDGPPTYIPSHWDR